AIIDNARKVYLAADSSKFGRNAMTRLGSLDQIDMLFTEAQPTEAFRELLARHEVRLEVT
ncbi:MAG TPA: DeoR family transcriptional regulator, partial [Pseudomonas sp.]|nr:DeoR family transcriptional regulator [Pseudomonas sp.]